MLQDILGWLTALPPLALYAALALAAAAENVFPPLPADTIVAFGAFLAAQGRASLAGAFLSTWLGNVAGAALMYGLGRRFGRDWLARRFPALAPTGAAGTRITKLYHRYGVPALFVSRFLPAARAIVPPLAGAMRLPMLTVLLAMALASGIWYGAIAALAYNVGSRWEDLSARVASTGIWVAVGAAVLVAGVGVVVVVRRRRHG